MSSAASDPTGLMGEGVGEAKRQDCGHGVMNKPGSWRLSQLISKAQAHDEKPITWNVYVPSAGLSTFPHEHSLRMLLIIASMPTPLHVKRVIGDL